MQFVVRPVTALFTIATPFKYWPETPSLSLKTSSNPFEMKVKFETTALDLGSVK